MVASAGRHHAAMALAANSDAVTGRFTAGRLHWRVAGSYIEGTASSKGVRVLVSWAGVCHGVALISMPAVMAATSVVVAAAPASADCGDPGQTPCSGAVPSADQIVAVMAELTDPDIPAANKGNIVTPGFSPDEAGTIDDHLNQMRAKGRVLPLTYFVTNVQLAPNNLAGATLETQATHARPIVLVDQGGHWLITRDTAIEELDAFWKAATRSYFVGQK